MTPEKPDTPQPMNRRAFLGRTLAIGAASVGATSLLAACGGGGNEATGVAVDASACEGYAALTDTELSARQALGYIDRSPNEEQLCSNCRFKAAYAEDASCIGCTLFAGPVSPGGYCTGWAAAV